MNDTRLQLDVLDTIDAVRAVLDACARGEWFFDEKILEHASSMLHRASLKLRADRFARGSS